MQVIRSGVIKDRLCGRLLSAHGCGLYLWLVMAVAVFFQNVVVIPCSMCCDMYSQALLRAVGLALQFCHPAAKHTYHRQLCSVVRRYAMTLRPSG